MKKSIKSVLTMILIFCFFGINIAQQHGKDKKMLVKPKNKKVTVIKKERVQFPDSVKQEMEINRGLLLRDSPAAK